MKIQTLMNFPYVRRNGIVMFFVSLKWGSPKAIYEFLYLLISMKI